MLSTTAISSFAVADTTTPAGRVVISGVGSAHGLGMAMDGVVGEARAGWSHDRILSTFYPGTTTRHFGGTIRVGLAEGRVQRFTLAGGGVVRSRGMPSIDVPAGARVSVLSGAGRPAVHVDGVSPPASSSPTPTPKALTAEETDPAPIPTAPAPTAAPSAAPTAPPVLTPAPTPTRPPEATPPPTAGADTRAAGPDDSVWITPRGDPAVTAVDATGKRYRGTIDVRPSGGSLRVINHVDLETYVRGIAEARGAGWPDEAMKALAVGARSLAAATMTWFDHNSGDGYDICPSENCQVYFGYDGEEDVMARAAAATAGQIRTYNGRPILAMYHGNGGGQTEDYGRVAQTQVNTYPYLTSVRYPFAAPSEWNRETSYREIAGALSAAGTRVPGPIQRIEVVERGMSPRVIRMKVIGSDGETELSGTKFTNALHLRSTWFFIGDRQTFATLAAPIYPHARVPDAVAERVPSENPWPAVTGAIAMLALAASAVSTARRLGLLTLAPRQRVALTPSPPGS